MLKRPIYGAAATIAALLAFAAGCGKRAAAHAPPPAKPVPVGWTETGVASWYGVPYDGRPSASGEIFDTRKLTAAHRTLPFETWVEVTNLQNGRRVEVRINDRGPFIDGRIIDLSFAAADAIDLVRPGIGRVRLKVVQPPKKEEPGKNDEPINKDEPNRNEPASQDEPVAILTSAGEFAVQAGAFSESARADAQAVELSRFGARVVKTGADSPLWRVLIGRSLTRQAAERLAARVKQLGTDAVVVRDVAPK